MFTTNNYSHTPLQQEQLTDPLIHTALQLTRNNSQIPNGRLKRIQRQSRIENGVLTKSGPLIVPPSLQKFVFSEYHYVAHFGTDKIYCLMKERFYWPNMYQYIRQFIASCVACQWTKSESYPSKAPLAKMFIPEKPKQVVSFDIAYLLIDSNGYQYILLNGDIFSKFITTVPLKDQTAPNIVFALLYNWILFTDFLCICSRIKGLSLMDMLCTMFVTPSV